MEAEKQRITDISELGEIRLIDSEEHIYNGRSWQPLRGRKIENALQTYSGYLMWPLQPHEDEIHVADIAHGLACEYRYANQSPYPYSVAWHSVALSHMVPAHLQKLALIHDAPEAYIKDMPRTIRQQEPFKSEYNKIDDRLLDVICSRFDVENNMEELHPYDTKMSKAEMFIWSERNPVYLAKLKAMKIDLEEISDPEWTYWIKLCPKRSHWFISEDTWLRRYRELFD